MATKKPSQKELIRRHLETFGTITPYQALRVYRCLRLAAVIFRIREDLRKGKSAWRIETEDVKQDEYQREPYAKYRLVACDGSQGTFYDQLKGPQV